MKRYADHERPSAQCYDCGLKYGGPGWLDALVSDEVWEKINPTYHAGAGLLCINCMAARLDELGLSNVPVEIVGGGALIPGFVTGLHPIRLQAYDCDQPKESSNAQNKL